MESFNIKTASTYVNNLLLSRGLLRDGKPIEFVHPSRAEGGKEATMAHIINLVHDLILKRDRDQEYRASVAVTMRNLRTEVTRQTLAMDKLQTRNDDLSRQLSFAQSQERAARAALRTAESSARSLREEMLRLKTTVQQVRTSCANDIRKRDVQIQRLKSHLTSQQRGNKTGLVGASITINPGAAGINGTGTAREDGPDTDDAAYSLRQETTEFLTQLSQSLSDENDNLIGLVRSTLVTLKELQGMPEVQRREDDEGLSTVGEEDEHTREDIPHALPTSYDTLAADMDAVLENLKMLLTNPNFVSVDEVELREEEIVRLRAGWEKMELRWRDALSLMEGWRKRMVNGDTTINLDELRMGLGLGRDLETVSKEDVSLATDDDEEGVSSGFDEDCEEAEELDASPSPEADGALGKTSASDMFKLKLQPGQPALGEVNGNARSPRKVAFSASVPNTPSEGVDENEDASGLDLVNTKKRTRLSSPSKAPLSEEQSSRPSSRDSRIPRHVRCDNIADQVTRLASRVTFSSSSSTPESTDTLDIDDLQTRKRLPSPHAHPDEPSPKLTVQDKLVAAQVEAEAAAIAEGLKAEKTADASSGGDDVAKRKTRRRSSPTKTRISGRPRRRKSTLTPEELQNLLGFE